LAASGWGVLQTYVGSSASGLSPVAQEKPSPPPEQSTVESWLQPVGSGSTTTPLLLPPPLLPLPPLLLPLPLAVAEHPSPALPPPTAAMATVNKNPLTVFQP
jgi:hypothetical protein